MAEYFSHDYDAQHDEKTVKLIKEMGWEGYGLYWGIVESLYVARGYLNKDYENLSFALHSKPETIKKVVEDFKLFESNSEKIFSKSILKRLKERKKISNKRKRAAKIMHKNKQQLSSANAEQVQSKCTAIKEKESKVNKSKVKESKEVKTTDAVQEPPIPPKPPKQSKTPDPLFVSVRDHILKTYEARGKGAYPYAYGEHDGMLKRLIGMYEHAGVMALWDCYLRTEGNNAFYRIAGWSIEVFVKAIPALLDEGHWKSVKQKYEAKAGFSTPNSILKMVSNGTDKN